MTSKCANSWCSTVRHLNDGKLFRLDIDIGSISGRDEHRTEYVWLCDPCSQRMHPKVEVRGNTVSLRLTKNELPPMTMEISNALLKRAN